jgi:hypothetical protein
MSSKPRKIYPRTFLPHERLLYWAEYLVAFANAEAPIPVTKQWEKNLQQEAAGRGLRVLRTAPEQCYVDLHSALRVYLDGLARFIDALGLPVDRHHWAGLARSPSAGDANEWKAWNASPMGMLHRKLRDVSKAGAEGFRTVDVSGHFVFDEYGQQVLFSPYFDWLPSAFTVAATDLLNSASTVLVRRCECELYKDIDGGCGLFLVQDYGPGCGRGVKPTCVPEHKLTQAERNELQDELDKLPERRKAKERTSLLRKFRDARKKV